MKITALILFLAIMQVSATTLAQKVSIKADNQPLSAIFDQISTQTGYDFAYTTRTLENAKPVTINVKNEELSDVLQKIFHDQPLEFTIKDKFVTVTVKIKPVIAPLTIHGNVTDEKGQPIPGATVKIKTSGLATITGAKGEFSLKNVDDQDVLVISFIGYQTREVNANGDLSNIKLELSTSKLDEVRVIAYGQSTPRFSVGNVSSVSAKEIGEQPVANPLLALEGRVPGLLVTQSSGMPGAGVAVQIQGQNSIGQGNDPLYVIDGVPFASQALPTSLGPGGSGTASPFFYLNPGDIESISVLKDADATSIYGSRAANGAILITTKKGKAGETRVNFNVQNGWGHVTRMAKLLHTQQYLQMRHEALANDSVNSIPASSYDINGLWDTTRYTDWQKKLIGGTAAYSDYNVSISGGTANTQYLVGTSYHRETTVFPEGNSDQKGSVHFTLNNASANQKFHLQLSASDLVNNNRLSLTDLSALAVALPPDAPALYTPDGSLNWMPNASGTSSWRNPLASLLDSYENKTNNLIANASLGYLLLPGLEIKSNFGYTNLQTDEFQGIPLSSLRPERRPTSTNAANYTNNNINTWIIEPQLNYKKAIGKGKLDILLGSTIQQTNSNGKSLQGSGYSSDQQLPDILSASSVFVTGSAISVYKYNALFGRLNYNLLDKYLIEVSARRDGSSRFGPENRVHDFASAGAAWIFSEENLIKNNLRLMSYGKLRINYGTTGNDQIGDYQFLSQYAPTPVSVAYQGATGLQVNSLPNAFLQWELTRKLQFGLDLGFFGDRILLTTNMVYNRSSNQLLAYALPSVAGFTNIIENFPATVSNTAFELTLNTVNIKSDNFGWRSGINLTVPRNKLLAFPDLASSAYASTLVIGQPVNIIKAYHLLGVDPATGVFQFASAGGGPTYSPNYPDDATALINTNPKFYGGFQNSFNYKGFQLDIFFQFVKRTAPVYLYNFLPGFNALNQPVDVLGRWTKAGDMAPFQRFSQSPGYQVPGTGTSVYQSYLTAGSSDFAYGDASFIRLKNLSVSYSLPAAWIKKAGLQQCRLYLQGQNLLTFTKYKGLDPETVSANAVLPPLKVLTLGLQVGL